MGLDPAIEALLAQAAQQQAGLTWSQLLGYVTNSMPAPGTLTLDAGRLVGSVAGQDTLDKLAQIANYTGQYNGADTLQKKAQDFAQGLGVMNLVGGLSGPANAFQQQAVLHGLNGNGMSRAVDAIRGTLNLPAF